MTRLKLFTKIISVVEMLVIVLSLMPSLCFAATSAEDYVIDVDFNNNIRGSADCKITVEANSDGDYDIYWGDVNNCKLSGSLGELSLPYGSIATVSVSEGTGSVELYKFPAVPDNAQSLLLYAGEEF